MSLFLPQIEQAGAALVAISPQTVKQSFFMHDQHKLRFPLLSDAGNKVARQFGLTYRVPSLRKQFIGALSSIYPSPMATTVGNCRFRRMTVLIAMERFSTRRRTRITRSDRNRTILCLRSGAKARSS